MQLDLLDARLVLRAAVLGEFCSARLDLVVGLVDVVAEKRCCLVVLGSNAACR